MSTIEAQFEVRPNAQAPVYHMHRSSDGSNGSAHSRSNPQDPATLDAEKRVGPRWTASGRHATVTNANSVHGLGIELKIGSRWFRR